MCTVLEIQKLNVFEDNGDPLSPLKAKVSASTRQDADDRHLFSFAALQSSFTLTHSLIASICPDTNTHVYSRVGAVCRVPAAALIGLI